VFCPVILINPRINPFSTKPENEKLWNIPDDVFTVLDSILHTSSEYHIKKIFKIIYDPKNLTAHIGDAGT
jgi:hypothetical protein